MNATRLLWLPGLLIAAGCSGLIGGDDDPGSKTPGPDGTSTTASCDGVCLGSSGLLRLTREEYRRSVEAIFGQTAVVDPSKLPLDAAAGPFSANDGAVTEPDVADYNVAAWTLAETLAPGLASECEASTCVDQLLDLYGSALFRRPIRDEDRLAYRDLFDWSIAEDDLTASVELVVATMLQSPDFLYRVEVAAEGDEPSLLDGLALATRLSFFLWRQGPDDVLREAALGGALDTPEGIETQARRLLTDPRADAALATFHREWLSLDDLPGTDLALQDAMRRETEGFAVRVFREEGAALSALFTSDRSPVSGPLAAHYGVAEGEDVAVAGHVGILTQASVMSRYASASYTRPVRRGDMLLNQVLCYDIGTTPPNALEQAEETSAALPEGTSDRDKLATVTGEGACATCHSIINPAGYVFEQFDEHGQLRASDSQGHPVDPSGAFEGFADLDGAFDGPATFMPRLAASEMVASCLSEQWLRFALERVAAPEDEATLARLQAVLADTGDLREVLVAITLSDAFRYRLPRP